MKRSRAACYDETSRFTTSLRRKTMRNAIVATILVSTLMTGVLHADTPKPLPADVGPGRIAWFDITTTDMARSKDFYGKLLDWKFTPVEGTEYAAEIVAGGTAIGTLR